MDIEKRLSAIEHQVKFVREDLRLIKRSLLAAGGGGVLGFASIVVVLL